MTDGYRATIIRTENLIGVKPLGKSTHGLVPEVPPHFADALLVEILDYRAMSVVLELTVSIQEFGDNRGNPAFLGSGASVFGQIAI